MKITSEVLEQISNYQNNFNMLVDGDRILLKPNTFLVSGESLVGSIKRKIKISYEYDITNSKFEANLLSESDAILEYKIIDVSENVPVTDNHTLTLLAIETLADKIYIGHLELNVDCLMEIIQVVRKSK